MSVAHRPGVRFVGRPMSLHSFPYQIEDNLDRADTRATAELPLPTDGAPHEPQWPNSWIAGLSGRAARYRIGTQLRQDFRLMVPQLRHDSLRRAGSREQSVCRLLHVQSVQQRVPRLMR